MHRAINDNVTKKKQKAITTGGEKHYCESHKFEKHRRHKK